MLPAPAKPRVKVKTFIKIGRPGYKVTKQKDTKTDQHSLLFQVEKRLTLNVNKNDPKMLVVELNFKRLSSVYL